jgi:hypothetical protein
VMVDSPTIAPLAVIDPAVLRFVSRYKFPPYAA